MHAQLKKEFMQIDADRNGFISRVEMRDFLIQKSGVKVDERTLELYNSLVSTLFEQMDADKNDEISLKEFCDAYYQEQRRLEEEVEDLDY